MNTEDKYSDPEYKRQDHDTKNSKGEVVKVDTTKTFRTTASKKLPRAVEEHLEDAFQYFYTSKTHSEETHWYVPRGAERLNFRQTPDARVKPLRPTKWRMEDLRPGDLMFGANAASLAAAANNYKRENPGFDYTCWTDPAGRGAVVMRNYSYDPTTPSGRIIPKDKLVPGTAYVVLSSKLDTALWTGKDFIGMTKQKDELALVHENYVSMQPDGCIGAAPLHELEIPQHILDEANQVTVKPTTPEEAVAKGLGKQTRKPSPP